jgi:hypothetical protein
MLFSKVSQTRGTPVHFVLPARRSYFNYKMRPTTQPNISSVFTFACNFIAVRTTFLGGLLESVATGFIFPELYVQGQALKIISLSSKRREICVKISNYLMLLHSFVSCLRECFLFATTLNMTSSL